MRKFQYRKAVQTLNLLAHWNGGIMNKMQALKLIWLSDRLHLRKYGRPILQDYYVAMDNGPVPSQTRDILQLNGMGVGNDVLDYSKAFIEPSQYEYKSLSNPNEKVFSKSDIEALKLIYDTYGKFDKYTVRDISHEFPEWKKWEDGLKAKKFRSHEMYYEDFFMDAGGNHQIFIDDVKSLELVKQLYLRKC